MGFGDLFENFNRWTGVHGLSVSGRIIPQHWALKTVFVLSFFLALFMFLLQLSLLIDQYQSREVQTSVVMQFKPLVFPSVTICNMNPFKKNSIFNSRELTELMSGYNFVTQLQSLPDSSRKRRRKREIAEVECTRTVAYSQYAHERSNNQSVMHMVKSCTYPSSQPPDTQLCIAGCGSLFRSFCFSIEASSCSSQQMLDDIGADVDRIFRNCVEDDICSHDDYCDNFDMAACKSTLEACDVGGQAAGLCLDSVSVVCNMLAETCNPSDCIKYSTAPSVIELTTTAPPPPAIEDVLEEVLQEVLGEVLQDVGGETEEEATPEAQERVQRIQAAVALIPKPKPPPPPPGVLPPKPPPNPPAPPGYPPVSEDPWVPPPPPPSPFLTIDPDVPPLPPPPPLEFNVLGLLSSGSEDAVKLVAELSNVAEELNLDTSASANQVLTDVQVQLVEVSGDLSSAERTALGYTKQELMVRCAFDAVACNLTADFVVFEDPDYGNCYTYNSNGRVISTQAGSQSGLKITVMANVDEYLFTTQQAGARVTVHPPGTVPFPNVNGFSASVGTSTAFKVRYNEFERMKKPYGDCTEFEHMSDYYFSGNYTYEGCYRSCFQKYVAGRCGCGDPRFPLPPSTNTRRTTISRCKRTNVTESACLNKVLEEETEIAAAGCSCNLPCWQQGYTIHPSVTQWPSNPNFFMATICLPTVLKASGLSCKELLGRNALTVEVFYDYFNYEVVVESPVMTKGNLWNQASGAGGLWFSISLISTTEIMLTLGQFLVILFGCGSIPDTPTTEPPNGRRADLTLGSDSPKKVPSYNAPEPNDILPPATMS